MITTREQYIILVDNDIIKPSDAIVILEGDGWYRIKRAVEIYNQGMSDLIVFSGEIDDPAYGSFPLTKILPHFKDAGIPENKILHERKSTNTLEQAQEIVNLAIENKWRKIILVASHYHQYRAYLTFLGIVKKKYPELIIYNAPVKDLAWYDETGWGKRINLLENEFKRIDKYSSLGHLASYEFALEYQEWKEKQV
ncbi:MAG: YdcF family protein [Firmicutes bacterium]|nr:YdcF family protein [Bacillota bacterium]